MGDSRDILKKAVQKLDSFLYNIQVSYLYTTKPLYYSDQDDFYNICVMGESDMSPKDFLMETQNIEKQLGRHRAQQIHPKGPRTLDIDIILWGNEIINTENLIVPHMDYINREFVLKPAIELDGKIKDPNTNEYLVDILTRLPDQGVYCLNETL